MANALYDKGRQKFLDGEIAWSSDDIKLVLVDSATYTVDLAADEFLSDIIAGARVSVSPNFTTKSSDEGVAGADDVVLSAVTGPESEAIVIYKDTGTEATSPLIAYIDSASGLPVTPNGGNIIITWDTGPNLIFKL